MANDTGDIETVKGGRVLALVGGLAVVIALAIGAMVSWGGSDDADAVPGSADAPGERTGSVAETSGSAADSNDGVEDSDGAAVDGSRPVAPDEGDSTVPVVGGTDAVDPGVVEMSVPALPQDEGSESATCAAIIVKLGQYRDLAESSGMPALAQLRFALEEFDNVTDFLADGHDWGLQIVEKLVLVRRDWSTAHTAHEEGDEQVAQERLEAAMDYLDAAIAVPCPE